MLDREAWVASGRRRTVHHGGQSYRLFTRVTGDGPWTTFLHGFPTSSWDWHKVEPLLPDGRTRLAIDHLGFGASDKPRDHGFSLFDQLSLVQVLWELHEVEETALVVHDYSVSMAQELLAQMLDDQWDGPEITGILLLNGGLFHSRIRPRPIQHLLMNRVTGPLVARLVTEGSFRRAMGRILSDEHPVSDEELAQHWAGIEARGGRKVMHRIARYQLEREANEADWTRALVEAPVPLRFVWGLQDPVSGRPMVDRLQELGLDHQVTAWQDVGHYPQLEVPHRVAHEVERLEAGEL